VRTCPAVDERPSQTLSGSSAIYFGILRVEGRILLYTVLPEDTGGVKRARALVHSRAVGSKLQHQATLTVPRAEDLTEGLVRSKLKLDTGSSSSSLPSSPNPQAFHSGPSPLRSNFSPTLSAGSFSNGPQHSPRLGEDVSAPQIPEKDQAQLARMRSNVSLRSAASTRLSPNPQSPQHFPRAGSPSIPHANTGVATQLPTERSRSPSGSGLGIGVAPQMHLVPQSPSLQVHAPQSTSAGGSHSTYDTDQMNASSSLPGSLEETTLQSMLVSDDPDSSVDTIPQSAHFAPSTAAASNGSRRVSTEVERQRVAESIARAAEERWHAHRRSSSQPRPVAELQEEGDVSQSSAASSSPKLRHKLQRELSLEQERLRNLQLEHQQLQGVQHQVEERREIAIDDEMRQEEEGEHSNTAYERERLLEIQRVEEERLAALKEEELQLLNYKRHAAEEARLAEQAQKEEKERVTREAAEERARADEEDRRRRDEEERLAREEVERQEQERREAEARRIQEAKEAEELAAREAKEAEERAKQAELDAAAELVKQRAAAKLAIRENIRTRLTDAQDPNLAVLTGFVSAQGGASIVSFDVGISVLVH